MSILFRAFSVSTCILTAVYYLILFRFYKGLKRTLWFPVLCAVLAINVIMKPALYPYYLLKPGISPTLEDIFYLVTLNLSSLMMNLYNTYVIAEEKNRYYKIFNVVLGISALFYFVMPESFIYGASLVSIMFCIFAYCNGLYNSLRMFRQGNRAYMYAIISYLVLLASFIPSFIMILIGKESMSFRIAVIPVYIFLHLIMLTIQYRESINRTREIADTLFETIDSITHSDNALQCTQLKSDFLYATLDLITEKCDSDSFTAEDLTISLSKFLRHTLNFQQLKGIVPLSNELELSKAYTSIEKERYGDIQFVYKLPLELPNVYVPPLSIQPLIENALEHGFDREHPSGKITIKISSYKDYCQIDVSDNGSGMPEEELERLPNSFIQTARIGLYSINKRLTERFGKGLIIQSAPGVGTSVSFVVPPEGRYTEEEVAGNV